MRKGIRYIAIVVSMFSASIALAQTKTITKTITIPNNGSVIVTEERVEDDDCLFGSGDGFIEVSVDGGVAPYTFQWFSGHDGGGTQISTDELTITGLLQGDYSVIVTDQVGCSGVKNFVVGYGCPYSPCSTITLIVSPTSTSDCTSHNGELEVSMNGIGPYNYSITRYNPFTDVHTPLQSGSEPAGAFHIGPIPGLDGGEYYVEVEDVANGCTKTETAIIENNNFDTYSVFAGSLTDCATPNGSITLELIGASDVRVSWKTLDGAFPGTQTFSSSTPTITNLPVGSYIMEVEDLTTPGCFIYANEPVYSYMAYLTVTLIEITDQTTCDPPNGSINVTVSGGSDTYSYQWTGGPTFGTSEDHNGVEAGDYNIYAYDKISGCQQNLSTPVFSVPAVLATPQSTITATDNTNCSTPFNGSFDLTAFDTPGPYAYDWVDDATSTIISNDEDPFDLPPASYHVTITDLSTGCKDVYPKTIIDNSIPAVSLSETITPSTSCIANLGNGAIDMTINTASYPYTVSWSGPSSFSSTSEDIGPVNAGAYTISVQVSCIPSANAAPVVTRSHPSIAFAGTVVDVDNGITVSDDGATLSSAAISITAGFASAEDVLAFDPVSGISGSYNNTSGVLTLTGVATVASYQTILQSVNYTNTASTPSPTTRTISFVVNDGALNSTVQTVDVTIAPNVAPVLAGSVASVDYSSGSLMINTILTVSDADDTNLASATVSITSGFVNSEDVLSSTAVAGITSSYNASTAVLTLSGSAPLASYQTALRSITYSNTNTTNRNKAQRTVSFVVNDGVINSNFLITNINHLNLAPVVATSGSNPQYVSGTLTFAGALTVTDADNTTLQNALISITSAFQSGEDVLVFTNQNGITGNYNPTTGILALTGNASLSNYQAALRSIAYQNTNAGDRNKSSRNISIVVNDGLTNSNSVSITVDIPNQAPTVTNSSSLPLYASGTILIAQQFTLTDADNATIQSASISISNGFVSSEDQLLFTNQNGINGSFNTGTGVLTLSGSAPKANYQSAIRAVQYQNTSTTPSEASRTFSIITNDGVSASNAAIVTLNINRPPTVTPTQNEINAGQSVQINITSIVTDPDNNVDFTNINSITIESQPSSGAIASVQNGMLSINYSNVPDFTGTDRLSVQVCDALGRCVTQELLIQVGGELIVYNAISPNNDNLNDFLFLRFINIQNNVKIFNRWGDKVYEVSNYDNEDRTKRFEGKNNNGNDLPSGTYFYKIEQPSGVTSGYLSVKHQ